MGERCASNANAGHRPANPKVPDGGKAMQVRTAWIPSAVALAAGVLATGMAVAARGDNFTEYALVVYSTPIIHRVARPRDECWTQTVHTDEGRQLMGRWR